MDPVSFLGGAALVAVGAVVYYSVVLQSIDAKGWPPAWPVFREVVFFHSPMTDTYVYVTDTSTFVVLPDRSVLCDGVEITRQSGRLRDVLAARHAEMRTHELCKQRRSEVSL